MLPMCRMPLFVKVIRKLVSLPPPSGSMRVLAKHPAVVVLNDVSKDKRYARFPSSVQVKSLTHSAQMSPCILPIYHRVYFLRGGASLSASLSVSLSASLSVSLSVSLLLFTCLPIHDNRISPTPTMLSISLTLTLTRNSSIRTCSASSHSSGATCTPSSL